MCRKMIEPKTVVTEPLWERTGLHGSFILATRNRKFIGTGSRSFLLRRAVAYGEATAIFCQTGSFDTLQLPGSPCRDFVLLLFGNGRIVAAASGCHVRFHSDADNPGALLNLSE
jgi:hypothetical protein